MPIHMELSSSSSMRWNHDWEIFLSIIFLHGYLLISHTWLHIIYTDEQRNGDGICSMQSIGWYNQKRQKKETRERENVLDMIRLWRMANDWMEVCLIRLEVSNIYSTLKPSKRLKFSLSLAHIPIETSDQVIHTHVDEYLHLLENVSMTNLRLCTYQENKKKKKSGEYN